MNIWEKIPSRVVSLSPLTEAQGGATACLAQREIPGSMRAAGWQGWCDGAFPRNTALGVGELFLSPASLLSQHCPGELCSSCSRERDAQGGAWMPNPPALCGAPEPTAPPTMGKTNLVSGSLQGIVLISADQFKLFFLFAEQASKFSLNKPFPYW